MVAGLAGNHPGKELVAAELAGNHPKNYMAGVVVVDSLLMAVEVAGNRPENYMAGVVVDNLPAVADFDSCADTSVDYSYFAASEDKEKYPCPSLGSCCCRIPLSFKGQNNIFSIFSFANKK